MDEAIGRNGGKGKGTILDWLFEKRCGSNLLVYTLARGTIPVLCTKKIRILWPCLSCVIRYTIHLSQVRIGFVVRIPYGWGTC